MLFETLLSEMWEEVAWIRRLQQFPNGRPLVEQNHLRLKIWDLFLTALALREGGVTKWLTAAPQLKST